MNKPKLNENLEAMYHLALRLEEIMREIEARAEVMLERYKKAA